MADALNLAEAYRLAQRILAEHDAVRYVPHAPTPRQREFLDTTALEALYGGAAGGGKSDALLMAALEHVNTPGYSAILFRRTFRDLSLPGALMDRAHQWLRGTDAHWNGIDKQWRFPSGAVLSFGYLDTEADKYRYQSAEFQFVGFDELTQFLETQYRYMLSRVRRLVGQDVPLRMRAATNPGGIGHDWVKQRFVDPGDPERPFVPALLVDNPHLDQESYRHALSQLDSTTRDQLERGLWVRDSGGLIYPYGPANLVQEAPGYEKLHWGLGIDLGASERTPTTALVLGCWHPQLPGFWAVRAEKHAGMIPSTLAERVREVEAEAGGLEVITLDEGALGKGYGGELRQRWGIPVQAAEKPNKLGYRKLLRGELEQALVMLVEPQCGPLLDEMGSLTWNERGDDNDKGASNHATDALLYLWRRARAHVHEPPKLRLQPGHPSFGEQEESEWLERDVAAARRRKERPWWTR